MQESAERTNSRRGSFVSLSFVSRERGEDKRVNRVKIGEKRIKKKLRESKEIDAELMDGWTDRAFQNPSMIEIPSQTHKHAFYLWHTLRDANFQAGFPQRTLLSAGNKRYIRSSSGNLV